MPLPSPLPLPSEKLTRARDVQARTSQPPQPQASRETLITSVNLLPDEYISLHYVGASAITEGENLRENLHFIFRDATAEPASLVEVDILLPDQKLSPKGLSLAHFKLEPAQQVEILLKRSLTENVGEGASVSVSQFCVLAQWLISASAQNCLILTNQGLGCKVNDQEYILIYDQAGKTPLPKEVQIHLNPLPGGKAPKSVLPGCLVRSRSRRITDAIYTVLTASQNVSFEISDEAWYSQNFGVALTCLSRGIYPTKEAFGQLVALLEGPLKAKPVCFMVLDSKARPPVLVLVPEINAPHIPANLILILFYALHKTIELNFMDDSTRKFIEHLREIQSESLGRVMKQLLSLGGGFFKQSTADICNEGSSIKALVDSLHQLRASLSRSDASLANVNHAYTTALDKVDYGIKPVQLSIAPLSSAVAVPLDQDSETAALRRQVQELTDENLCLREELERLRAAQPAATPKLSGVPSAFHAPKPAAGSAKPGSLPPQPKNV